MNRSLSLSVALVLAFGVVTLGCAAAAPAADLADLDTEDVEESSSALTFHGTYAWWLLPSFDIRSYGFQLYGRDLNGRSLNGQELGGHGLLGESLTNVRVRGRVVSATLDGTTFRTSAASGRDMVGATFDGVVDDGTVLPVRIDAITQDPSPAMRDVLWYDVSYRTESGWRSLCGADASGKAVPAVPLSGRWDYRQGVSGGGSRIADSGAFTFACAGYALAKCVGLGYKPWSSWKACTNCSEVPLADLHQACTRAIRADYCGDGTSYTDDGQLIDLTDRHLIQLPRPGWPFEAEWDARGARCAARLRVPSRGTPTCWNELTSSSSCGSFVGFFRGTLLMTQKAP